MRNAMAYDMPIPGYGNDTVNNLHLWSAKATRDFDLRLFNSGNYIHAIEEKTASEKLSEVLYPDDSTDGHNSPELAQALDMIGQGYFSPEAPDLFKAITGNLWPPDPCLLMADYASYIACQERVDALYSDPAAWARRAILNVAHMGKFSADRTIREYAEHIWRVAPIQPAQLRIHKRAA